MHEEGSISPTGFEEWSWDHETFIGWDSSDVIGIDSTNSDKGSIDPT